MATTVDKRVEQTPTQSSWKYFLRALLYFILLAVINTLSYSGAGRALEPVTPEWLTMLLENTAYLIGVVVLTWAFCRFIDHRPVRDLGLQRQGSLRKLAVGGGLGLFLQSAVFGALALAGWLTVEQTSIEPIYLVASMISWTIISFNEELSFRGYILQRLSLAWGMVAAVIASSIVFAAVHTLNPNVQPLSIMGVLMAGLLLATAYLVSRSLWLPIGLHIAWNLAEIHLFGFAGSGFSEPAILRTTVSGPEMITGGAFGPEGGLIGIAASLVGISILLLSYRIALARTRQNETGGIERG